MQVIVNELEVIAVPPSNGASTDGASGTGGNPPGPTPRDIYWVNRKLNERRLRLKAR